jgi:cytochrome P450
VERLRPRIQAKVDAHLDRCEALGIFDLVTELADQLPSQVICELLGVPEADQPQIELWTADIAATVTPALTDEILTQADKTVQEFHAYLREQVAARRTHPRQDLLTAMVQAEDVEGRLNDDELVSFAVTVLGAGTETTTNLIGVGTLALLENPSQLARLRSDPALIHSAVEELLRFEPPVQLAFIRVAMEDTAIGGEEIIENELVFGLIGAANHDPAVFPDPQELRIDRPLDTPHIAFGQGPHYCMGAALARAEGEIALRTLLVDRFPDLTLVEGESRSWRDAFTLRGVKELVVSTGR